MRTLPSGRGSVSACGTKGLSRVLVRPLQGQRYRDVLIEGITRVSHGAAPLGEEALEADASAPPVSVSSVLTTTAVATGLKLEIPYTRGLALTTRLDLEYVHGNVDHGPSATHLMGLVTVGVTAIVSTDKRRTVRRDPEAEAEEAGEGVGGAGGGGATGRRSAGGGALRFHAKPTLNRPCPGWSSAP